jgi:hypothetical protein
MDNKTRKSSLGTTIFAFLFSFMAALWHLNADCQLAEAAPPIADAGSDRELAKDSLHFGNVSLAGSISPGNNDALVFEWYGPFGQTTGPTPTVQIPLGTYTISFQAVGCPASSNIDTAEITIAPAFIIAARSRTNVVQLTWTHLAWASRYDIYRAQQQNPLSFEKIAETTSTYSTYLDDQVVNETNYLYAVAAIDSNGNGHYSNIVASCPPASRTTARLNRPPIIYSPTVGIASHGMPFGYTVLAADANLDTLTFRLTTAFRLLCPSRTVKGLKTTNRSASK